MSQEMLDLGIDDIMLSKRNWQTKDLDNAMAEYVIQSGKLMLRKYRVEEWVPGDPKAKSWSDRIGYLNREEPYYEEQKHHGIINFYEHLDDVQGKWDCWVEYNATFTNGILDKIELSKFEKTDNEERKRNNKAWADKLQKERAIWYNKYFFHTKAYRWFSNKIWYRFFTKLANICNKIAIKL